MRKVAPLLSLLLLALAAPLAVAAPADQKQVAFDAIERNAQQITDISDSIFYFAELGMHRC